MLRPMSRESDSTATKISPGYHCARRNRRGWSACLIASIFVLAATAPVRADLDGYVARAEPAFAWSLRDKAVRAEGTVYDLHLVSQVWRGITWKHQLRVYVPARAYSSGTMLLFNTGGSARDSDNAFGLELAKRAGAPCAIVYGIPNQPLFDDLYEDDLIAYTFVQYLRTGDENWPLLMPMTKSLVKAMDALQAFARDELGAPVDGFVVAGASKRGWTSWLTAAADPRVKGVAPIVFDMLNIPAQLPHQLASWGNYSEMLEPYTAPGLPGQVGSERGRRLVELVDPYSYRERVGMPKLMVLGTNDRYWTLDALNLYWDDLSGPRSVLYVANQGHGLGDRARWMETLACFVRGIARNDPMPRLTWVYERAGGKLTLKLTRSPALATALLWTASSQTRDFRGTEWSSVSMATRGDGLQAEAALSDTAFVALFGEVEYPLDGNSCRLSTRVRIEAPLRKNH
jgi:PhoPQ-activated pathogenicity-related protein